MSDPSSEVSTEPPIRGINKKSPPPLVGPPIFFCKGGLRFRFTAFVLGRFIGRFRVLVARCALKDYPVTPKFVIRTQTKLCAERATMSCYLKGKGAKRAKHFIT